MATPPKIARSILGKKVSYLSSSGTPFDLPETLSEAEGQMLVSHFYPLEFNNDAEVTVVEAKKLDQVFILQETPWDDELRIHLNDRPVDHLSPDREAAPCFRLWPFRERVPLIIDQPEDNLDNRMVGSTLTRILADLKEDAKSSSPPITRTSLWAATPNR